MLNVALRLVEGAEVDKEKALEAAISQIERSCGKGSIMRLGQNEKAVEVEAISTGSLGLDIALGIGGLPRGRVVEIYGPESSGKTTLVNVGFLEFPFLMLIGDQHAAAHGRKGLQGGDPRAR